MNKVFELFKKYKELILYIFFGGCTTLVNIVCYYICAHILSMTTTMSTIIAWVISVAFAYITNKLFVFESRNYSKQALVKEISSFVGCRLASGVMDLGIMIIFVDFLLFPDLVVKIISNVIVIIVNYVASKFYIFKNNDEKNIL